jgi:hypothetical protein
VATRWFNHDHFGARSDIFDRNFPSLLLATQEFAPHHPLWMVEEPISLHRVAAEVPATFPQVTFDRLELNRILTVYGRMVAVGEWRDYALDFLDEVAVFSIFRHASEMPLFRIEKRPKLRAKQGQYSVMAAGGLILKRGQELAQVLKVFDKKLLKAL